MRMKTRPGDWDASTSELMGRVRPNPAERPWSVMHHGEAQTRTDSASINVNRAGPALPVVAALLGAGQGDGLTNAIQQCRPRVNAKLRLLAVDPQRYGNHGFHGRARFT